MLNPKMKQAYNEQIQHELYSAYVYLGMAAYFESSNLPGFAHWMRIQVQEELFHASKLFDFVYERDADVELFAIDKPSIEYESPLAAFEAALAHERFISGKIHDLYALAMEEKDFASQPLLHWFIEEQVEEEASAKDIVDQLNLVAGSKMGFYMLDKQMAARVFTPPAAEGAE
jgi:ferritin